MRIKITLLLFLVLAVLGTSNAQTHDPKNGAEDEREWTTVFINAHIKTATYEYESGQMLIRGGRIIAVGEKIKIPEKAEVIDLEGKWIYPSFIELCSEYGLSNTEEKNENGPHRRGNPQLDRTTSGAKYWNEAVHPEYKAIEELRVNQEQASDLLAAGFGVVLTGKHDGVIQGSSTLLMLGGLSIHQMVIAPSAAQTASFTKGSSKQDYPNSQMGSIALLRQAVLDAQWYAAHSGINNVSLDALALHLKSPWVGYTSEWQEVLRMDQTLKNLGIHAIIRGNGDEFEKLDAISGMHGFLVVPFYQAPQIAKKVALSDLPYTELQSMVLRPQNLALISKKMTSFGITASGLTKTSSFGQLIREAVIYGLDADKALAALTLLPAQQLGMTIIGDLKPGYLANFFICDSNYFMEDATIISHWTNGRKHFSIDLMPSFKGKYSIEAGKDTLELKITQEGDKIKASIGPDTKAGHVLIEKTNTIYIKYKQYQLNGAFDKNGNLSGSGFYGNQEFAWVAKKAESKKKEKKKETYPSIEYSQPFAYANQNVNDYMIRNVTVWTSSSDSILYNTDVLVIDGKIKAIGQNLQGPEGIRVVDGTGKHLTPGIIDEHSHIAISKGVNEGTQAITSEVRIEDVVNSNDINIYRQLAGGVTTSHLLHGSANPIGGQTALIKLRYGAAPNGLMFGNDHRYIKFALGENVKQSNWGDRQVVRFPQTRMGVEQVFIDGFTRALEYEKCRKTNSCAVDLELEALLEIINSKRFITCHSYRQDEINMLMHVADSFGFTVNTFTHILEGYKVADKMHEHGVGGSTFADWWGYKFEVNDAIPWNAAILNENGVITSINSDDAEMGRRLNQEAAKTVKYGQVSEFDALKMVTINPAKLLHIDNVTGSIEVGKDADLVLWSDHPLSNYALVETTWVDGIIYFSLELNDSANAELAEARLNLINILLSSGVNEGSKPKPDHQLYHCDDMEGYLHDQEGE